MVYEELPPWPDVERYSDCKGKPVANTRAEFRVGVVAFHNTGRRVYLRTDGVRHFSAGPMARYAWEPILIRAETRVSWVAGGEFHPIKDRKRASTDEYETPKLLGLHEVEARLFLADNCYRVAKAVERIRDAELLKAVAALIDYHPLGFGE